LTHYLFYIFSSSGKLFFFSRAGLVVNSIVAEV
jgi:hypothetical protein